MKTTVLNPAMIEKVDRFFEMLFSTNNEDPKKKKIPEIEPIPITPIRPDPPEIVPPPKEDEPYNPIPEIQPGREPEMPPIKENE
jgi:hypothetical protein